MVGIVSYGAYIPLRRLTTGPQTEKAVANWDEDSLTMAVAAGIDCLNGIDRKSIDGLYFATTTPPYGEKLTATTAAWALDLRHDILTADITDSLRAGTGALKMAADAVGADSAKNILVAASDLRLGGGGLDSGFGDGAAAFIIGDKNVIATNLRAPFLCTRAAFRIMKKQGGGRIINIGSISASRVWQNNAPYNCAKFGLVGFTHTTALEGRKFNITCGILHPGNTERDIHPPEGKGWTAEPYMSQEEIAAAAVFMASQPPHINVLEIIQLHKDQLYLGRG